MPIFMISMGTLSNRIKDSMEGHSDAINRVKKRESQECEGFLAFQGYG
jgi:hypothetical protein